MTKYLKVIKDGRLSYKQHVQHGCVKANTASTALVNMMPNLGGSKYTSETFIATVMNSILLYAVPVRG